MEAIHDIWTAVRTSSMQALYVKILMSWLLSVALGQTYI